jgi:pimeloyl-ACP methyl ester carboxylesterase
VQPLAAGVAVSVPDSQESVFSFKAGDGRDLQLLRVRGPKAPEKGPVLLVHGAGVRANIFRAPVSENLVQRLVREGYDVWLEQWRASIDLPFCRWTLDQAALYDHPKAVAKIVEETGWPCLKAVVHCQGSTSFTMSALAGLVPQVDTIVSNAVSLVPVVPRFARAKLNWALPVLHRMTECLNPRWGDEVADFSEWLIRSAALLVHHECSNAVCKMVSFTYGAGFPALWLHENLNPETHEWLRYEFARVPLTFFDQIRRCVAAGGLQSVEGFKELPEDFLAAPLRTEARWTFVAGEKNLCFLPESQVRAHRHFDQQQPGRHVLRLFPNYSHLDVFMGHDASRDTFPCIVEALEKGA